nr:MAG: ORF1 [TTV-like mini virus]
MPYYYKRWRRPRRFWRRRAGKTIRRRYWRTRRRYWRRPVRKRKLSKIIIRQWQPKTKRKLKIRGMYPLFLGTRARTGNNMNQYLDSVAPHGFPGGGLWSVARFTLNSLYGLHKKARNWWTYSNCQLPLIKYLGCSIKLYRSLSVDYIFLYTNCGSMEANLELYQSATPSILNLNKNKIIVTCDNGTRPKKPYKKIFVKPPAMFESKWYAQQDLANVPLLMTISAATSLNRWYTAANAESNTIGFLSLNTELFVYHNFKNPPTDTGYIPNDTFLLFTFSQHKNFEDLTWKDLIYLANTKDMKKGRDINSITATSDTARVDQYFADIHNWGNPFYPDYLDPDYPDIIVTNQSIDTIKQKAKANYSGKIQGFTKNSKPFLWACRYNPYRDSSHNAVYITPIYGPKRPWENPADDKRQTSGLPLWLLLHGLTDYHAKAVDIQALMTDNILAIVSDYIDPPNKDYYVPIDHKFLEGKSPYDTILKANDELFWFPKLNFQQESINEIVTTAPGSPKLQPDISVEASMQYTFLFKLGGCPPPMDNVCDPTKSGKYPTPNNMLQTTLLQSPATPIEWYLHSFDQRRGMLTERAAKRIKKDRDFTDTLFEITGQTSTEVPIQTHQESSDETSEEEKDQDPIQLQLQHQRRKQRKLRNRLLQLIQLMEST